MKEGRSQKKAPDTVTGEDRLRLLETALEHAINRSREAKLAAKQAKNDAKLAKKDKKKARRALIEAQEQYGLRPVENPDDAAEKTGDSTGHGEKNR